MKSILCVNKGGSEGEGCKQRKSAQVLSFNKTLKIVLIPCVKDYQAGKLCNHLWYNIDDYRNFHENATEEIQALIGDYNSKYFYCDENHNDSGYEFNGHIITGRLDVLRARKILYQPNSTMASVINVQVNTRVNNDQEFGNNESDGSDRSEEPKDETISQMAMADKHLLPSPTNIKKSGAAKVAFEECDVIKHQKSRHETAFFSSSAKHYRKKQRERQLSGDDIYDDEHFVLGIPQEKDDTIRIYDNCVVLLEDNDNTESSSRDSLSADLPPATSDADVEYRVFPSCGYMLGEYPHEMESSGGLLDTVMQRVTGSPERIPRLPALGGFQLHDMFMDSFESSGHAAGRTRSSFSGGGRVEKEADAENGGAVFKVPLPFLTEASLIRLQKGDEAKNKGQKKEGALSTVLAVCSTFAFLAFRLTETSTGGL